MVFGGQTRTSFELGAYNILQEKPNESYAWTLAIFD